MNKLKVGTRFDAQTEEQQDIELYVNFQKSKEKRDIEKTLSKFEQEKQHQRTTLFIRNYPQEFTEQTFKQLFGTFGEIKNIIMKNGYTLLGFDHIAQASEARDKFNGHTINGKTLQIKFYESKLVKQQQFEELLDKKSFSQYKQQQDFGQFQEMRSDQFNNPQGVPNLM